jgi:hypothetical protein
LAKEGFISLISSNNFQKKRKSPHSVFKTAFACGSVSVFKTAFACGSVKIIHRYLLAIFDKFGSF